MKRIISLILSLVILLGGLTFMFSGTLSKLGKSELEIFTDDVNSLINGNDEKKSSWFTSEAEENDEESPFKSEEMKASANARVIVKSPEKIDTLNAIKVVEGYNDLHVLQFETKEDADKALEYYNTLPNVDYVQKDAVFKTCEIEATAQDANKESIDISTVMPEESKACGFPQLKKYFSDNNIVYERELVVAIVDTGIESTHEMLKDRVVYSDFNSVDGEGSEDDNGHGTHVAGIVVANSLENVKVKSYKALNNEGEGTDLQIYLGVQAAIDDRVNVINCSFGRIGVSDIMTEAVQRAYSLNIPVVAAAGNDFIQLRYDGRIQYTPACIPECITVMACVTGMEGIPGFTNYGEVCDIAAPGVKVNSAYLNNTYKKLSGTSMSTPFASAAVTYLLLDNPDMTCAEVDTKMKEYSLPFDYYMKVGDIDYIDYINYIPKGDTTCLYVEYYTREITKATLPKFSVTETEFTETFTFTITSDIEDAQIFIKSAATPGKSYSQYRGGPITVRYDSEFTAFVAKKGMKIGDRVTQKYKRIITDEDSKYDIDQNGNITAYYGDDEEVLIVPETVDGITVKNIKDGVFRGFNMKTVILPDTMRSIDNAFMDCHSLEYVRMNSVNTIGATFANCENLKYIECENLRNINGSAFLGCTNLQYGDFENLYTIGKSAFCGVKGIYGFASESLTQIGTSAFENSSIAYVYAPKMKTIAISAFKGCENLERVEIPAATDVWADAFKDCTALKKVECENAKSVSGGVFENCSSLEEVYLPKIELIADKVFKNCVSLHSVYAPNLSKQIDEQAFENCISIKEIDYPNITKLEERAFAGCTSLEKVNLPKVQEMYINSFYNCPMLYELELPSLLVLRSLSLVTLKDEVMSVNELVLDNAEKVYILPNDCNLALSSTVSEILTSVVSPPIDFSKNTTIFATKGTHAYNWAVENKIPVKEIAQETAIIKDLKRTYTIGEDILKADVIGFNRTYQWYGNTEEDNQTGVLIEGANDKFFNPSDYQYYPYYYCVVTSTDKGYEAVEIRTGLSKDQSLCADYSSVDAAIDNIPKDLSIYSPETLSILQEAVDSVVYYLPPTAQAIVDSYAVKIIDAVNSLENRMADYSKYNALVDFLNSFDRSLTTTDFTEIDRLLAIDISGKDYTQQDEVDAHTQALSDQVDQDLRFLPADYTEYYKAYADAMRIVESRKYTEEELEGLCYALELPVWLLDIRGQADIDAATNLILLEIYKLEGGNVAANYTKYNNAVEKANAIDRSLYKDLTALDEALSVDVSNKNITEQDIVDAQADAILAAIASLEYKEADYTEYKKAVEKASAIDRSLYKDLSALDEALSVDVSNKNITEQDVVDAQANAILSAIDSLEYKSANYTKYNEAVEKANTIDRSLYKDLTALDEALSVDVSNKNITEQDIVDAQADVILSAISSLEYKEADYTNYNEAVKKANAIDRSLYKDLAALDEALSVDISDRNITEQDVVDAQADAILSSIASLEYKSADYTKYNKAVEKANAIDRSLYKDLTALDEALSVDVSNKNITEQNVVDIQTTAILSAIDSLEYKEADYTKYNNAVEKASAIDRNLYKDLTALDEALSVDVSKKNITEQDIVDAQADAILSAISSLEYKSADYTRYNEAVEKATAIDRSLYKDLSALDEARSVDVSNKNITEQDIIDVQTTAILSAIDSLEYKNADYTKYNDAVEKASAIDRSLYKDLSALDEALSVDVSNKNITEQDIVDAQADAILSAIASLEYKSANYTKYNEAVEKATAIDRSLYKDLSALDEALSVDVSNKNITEQDIVDVQTTAILSAISSLEYKEADYTKYNNAVEKASAIDRNLYKDLTALDEALSVDVSNKNITEQDIVDAQAQAILDAINGLEVLPPKPNTVIADVNGDGKVSVVDAKLVLKYIAGLIQLTEDQKQAADVNNDDKISIIDAKWILQLVVGTRVI